MTRKLSRLQPQNQYWYEDLPARDTLPDLVNGGETPHIGGELRCVDETILEISRTSSAQRGLALILGIGILVGLALISPFLVEMYTVDIGDFLLPALIMALMLIAVVCGACFLIRRATRTPRDLPIRFNRTTGSVQVLDYVINMNPFGRWRIELRSFNWNQVEAELVKIAGYNGKTYSIRYGLVLAGLDVHNGMVRDRIALVSGAGYPNCLRQLWAFIRIYMHEGVSSQISTPQSDGVSLGRCILADYPFLDFTEDGKRRRAAMGGIDWIVCFFVMVPLFWIFVPVSVFEYIALVLAPVAKWPDERGGLQA